MKIGNFKIKALVLVLFAVQASLIGQNIDKGLRYIELNQINHAKGFFINALKQNPNNTQLWRYLGDIYFTMDRLDSSEYYYNKGIELNKEDAYNYAGLVKLFLKKNNQTEARTNIDKALKIKRNSKDAAFFVYLADAYFLNNNYDMAMSYLDKARDINKALPEIYIARGDIFISQNKNGEAANEFDNKALFYDKNNVKAYYELGKLYVLAWNYEEAHKAFMNVIKIDSNYIPVYKDLGELYYRANKNKDAANSYAKYISMSEVIPADIARYAQMLYFTNNYLKSSEFIDKFLKADSSNFVLLRLQTYNSYELGDYNKVLKAFNKMLKLVNKENKLIISDYDYYAKLLLKNNKDSLAIENYLIVIKMDSSKTNYYEDIAKIYEKLNKNVKSVKFYEKFVKSLKSPGANEYYQLGKACYRVISDPTIPIDSITKKKLALMGDSVSAKVIQLLPAQFYGYIYRARINSVMDADAEKGLAKPFYEQTLQIIELTPDKFKKELIEAYEYLGYYYYIKNDIPTSKTYWEKIITIDPENGKAKDAIKGLTKPRAPRKKAQ